MKSLSFDETFDSCDQINCDQSNYKFIQSTISENTTKKQLRELIDILEKKI